MIANAPERPGLQIRMDPPRGRRIPNLQLYTRIIIILYYIICRLLSGRVGEPR